ncbi:hypothetical protein Dimus_003308, partial [Dionaea muscipula]
MNKDRKRQGSSRARGLTRLSNHATIPVTDKRVGRPSFLDRRSEKAPDRRSDVLDRRSERTTDKWFDDSFLDRGSEKTPDKRSSASQACKEAKDKNHIQCFVCDQYGHYNTQCDQNLKARKYLHKGNHSEQHTPTTIEGGGHEDPIPMDHVVNATIIEGD